jgi:branched-chain amino acid aminotransferase
LILFNFASIKVQHAKTDALGFCLILVQLKPYYYEHNQANKIDIIKSPTQIKEVDFENLSFGSVFTDHLMECDFTNGEWQNQSSNLIPFLLDPSARVFIMAKQSLKECLTKTIKMQFGFLDLMKTIMLLNNSARMAMPEVPEDVLWKD